MGLRTITQSRSLSVCIEHYLTELLNAGAEEMTVWTYTNRLRWFSEWLTSTGIPLEAVTHDTIQQWISDQRVRLNPRTKKALSKKYIHDNVGAVKVFFKWLVAMDVIPKDPFALVRPIKVPDKLPEILDVKDVLRLIDGAQGNKERVVLELLYGSGVRKSELLGIDLDDLRGSKVLIRGKGGRERLQPMSPQTVEAIQAWLPERAEILARGKHKDIRALLVTRKGRMQRQTVLNLVHAVAERVGIDRRVYPHLFRHCFATHLLDGGAKLEEVQELLDHREISTTRIYTRVSRERIQRAYESAHPRMQMR